MNSRGTEGGERREERRIIRTCRIAGLACSQVSVVLDVSGDSTRECTDWLHSHLIKVIHYGTFKSFEKKSSKIFPNEVPAEFNAADDLRQLISRQALHC